MDLRSVKWIEHAAFLLEIGTKSVYIDPFRLRSGASLPRADVVFVTHDHFDHLNDDAIAQIAVATTQFVAPSAAAAQLCGRNVLVVSPNQSYSVDGIRFRTVPAYNLHKEYHPKSGGMVGYIIDMGGMSVYHAGDTDFIDEMRSIEVDVALLPIGGTYTMDVIDAAAAAKAIRAKAYVPMHYRALLGKDGSAKAEEEFRKRVPKTVLLEQIQTPFYSF